MNDALLALVSGGGGAIIVALLNAVFNRRKLSAEATEIITKAAAGTVENIMADNKSLREELNTLRGEVALLREAQQYSEKRERLHQLHEERWRYHMERWHRYVARLIADLRATGRRDIEDPPPMWPELPPAGP